EFTTGVAKPVLVSPIGGALTGGVNTPLRPVLSWNSVDGANRYELQVDTSASFFAPFVNLTDTGRLDATAYQIDKDLAYDTTYYWRVRSATFTSLGDWSTVGAFTTMSKPVAGAPPIVVQQQPAPIINIPAPTTPSWVWVVIVIGAILVIVMVVLIVRTRRV
ncbi:MAG: fibronectin type III domain-containing protein, partial [Dehalococcoidia bacterium]|nr:fibronectin type III domain-containing protein [Dehalococcoidia bacterium]